MLPILFQKKQAGIARRRMSVSKEIPSGALLLEAIFTDDLK
jgi:hypothetical protein